MATADGVTVEYKPDRDPEDGTVRLTSPRHKQSSVTSSAIVDVQRKSSLIPILFERSAKSWWNPKFDSSILEDQYGRSNFPLLRRRFQYALAYIIICCITWCIFFGTLQKESWVAFLIVVIVLLALAAAILGFTFTSVYKDHVMATSVSITAVLFLFLLLVFADHKNSDMSMVSVFVCAVEILLMVYTMVPLPLYLCVILGGIFSVALEILSGFFIRWDEHDEYFIVGRILIHIGIHLTCIHIHIMTQVRTRSTFLKVGQSIMSRKEMELEKQIKHQMISSLMPTTVAEEVMKSREEREEEDDPDRGRSRHRHSSPERGKMTFRSFHMTQMDHVSILFADIVGFTKMSSGKPAEQLVSLLNDLFGRFDELCQKHGCEKISTLGDCYYCVSGCPEARTDHARCCVEMGLSMCKAIIQFDEDHNESVNMRVGVHTGTVLCGLVGTRRFKFDVWSHDVTLANTMESEGKPGQVHVSESTYQLIKDYYNVEEGDPVEGMLKILLILNNLCFWVIRDLFARIYHMFQSF